MALSQLQLTNAGTRELAKGQALTLTKIAIGDAQQSNPATATDLSRKVGEVAPTVTTDGDYQVIEGVFDNIALNVTAEKNIQEVGIFGKVGNGPETLIYYAKGQAFLFPAKTQQQMTVKMPFRVKITGAPEVRVEINNQISGMATVESVNRVQDTVNKFKTGSPSELEGLFNVENFRAIFGKLAKYVTNSEVDNLSTPGIYQYATDMGSKGVPSGYGFIAVVSNGVKQLGQAGNFTWQFFFGTNGRVWIRKRINAEQWFTEPVASGNYLNALLKRLGLNQWLLDIDIVTCSSGTNFGTFVNSSQVPVGFSIVRDMNAPVKEVFVWKPSTNYVYCFAPHWNGDFYVGAVTGGSWKPWTNLSQHTKLSTSQNNQDFGDYLKSDAVPVGISMQKDSKSGAFGTATKVDNNNVMFSGTLRKGNKTYQVVMSIVNGVKPSAFTEWPLTD
nr:MAG TPA: tail-collar fiber protein [Caudoviricetes sp.]